MTFSKKPANVQAVQFENVRQFRQAIKEWPACKAEKITGDFHGAPSVGILSERGYTEVIKGQWAVLEITGEIRSLHADDFHALYVVA